MIIDLVLYFGAIDSPDASDSVFRLFNLAGAIRGYVGGVGWDDCRVNAAPGDALGVLFKCGGVTTAAARAAADEPGRCAGNSFCIGFGDSTGGLDSKLSVSSDGKVFSLQSLGQRDSVEPLFLNERVMDGRSFRSASNRASSICLSAIWPLSSSRRLSQSGIDVQSVFRASIVEYAAIV
jgi:hypothetical protein